MKSMAGSPALVAKGGADLFDLALVALKRVQMRDALIQQPAVDRRFVDAGGADIHDMDRSGEAQQVLQRHCFSL
jgi:hypothetical protein